MAIDLTQDQIDAYQASQQHTWSPTEFLNHPAFNYGLNAPPLGQAALHPPSTVSQQIGTMSAAQLAAQAAAPNEEALEEERRADAAAAAAEAEAKRLAELNNFDYPEPIAGRHEYSGPSGALCRDCQAKDHAQPLTTAELKECLVHHVDVKDLTLFRLQSFPVRPSMPGTSVADLSLSDQDRRRRVRDYEMKTFGEIHDLEISLIEVTGCDPLPIRVQRFEPMPGDDLEKKWICAEGHPRGIDLGPWAMPKITDYIATLTVYLHTNCQPFCLNFGFPLRDMVQLADDPDISEHHKLLFSKLTVFIFAAMQKSSTATIVQGAEAIGAELIEEEEGHRLHYRSLVPRMVLGQQDPVDTLAVLIPAHQELMGLLLPLYDSSAYEDWGAIFTCLACLLHMSSRLFQDRRRHATENEHPRYYTMPEFVRDSSKFLMVLITRFHHLEETKYTREDCLAKGPFAYRKLYQNLSVRMAHARHSPTDIHRDTWWLGQLLDPPDLFRPHKTPDWPLFDFDAAPEQKKSPPQGRASP